MGDKSPKSKKKKQGQNTAAKKDKADKAKTKQEAGQQVSIKGKS